MKYEIYDDCDNLLKKAGREILFLNKGDVIWVCEEIPYMVTNKHIDYIRKTCTVYTESVY
jgi:hypothetical protein